MDSQRLKPNRPAVASMKTRVVVIEDQDDIRTMLVSMLELEDFEVFGAANGCDGVELITRAEPGAAIVDIGLPDIDGYEVARRVRSQQAQGGEIQLIALTGYDLAEDVRHALAAGFDHHLVKPFEPAKLFDLLNKNAKSNVSSAK